MNKEEVLNFFDQLEKLSQEKISEASNIYSGVNGVALRDALRKIQNALVDLSSLASLSKTTVDDATWTS